MRRALIIVLLVGVFTSSARADGDVGVVATGDTTMQPQVLALIEGWLRAHGHQVVASPLPPEGANKLIDCFVIEDTGCARKIIESQANTATVVFARVDVTDNAGSGMRDVTITAYWFERGSEPVAEKRLCEKCTDATLRSTGDELMSALAGSSRKTVGQLKLTSEPSGAHVTIDGAPAGVTPVEVALAPGVHQVVVNADGHADVIRTVTIVQGETAPLEIKLGGLDGTGRRPKLPLVLIGAGSALTLTGLILFATSETDTGEKFEYRDTRALGATLGLGGLAVASVGIYLWFHPRKATDSAPSVAIVPGGAYLGWGKTF